MHARSLPPGYNASTMKVPRALRCSALLLLAAMFCHGSAAAGGGEDPQGKDRKDAPSGKIEGWGELEDSSGECKARKEGARVVLEVPAGSFDLWPEGQKVNAPRLVQDAEGDFTVEVKVAGKVMGEKGAEPAGRDVAFNAATLVIWQDEKNFVRLDRAGFHKAGKPNHQTYYHVYQDGKRAAHAFRPLAVGDSWLKLERRGGRVTASFSEDGKTWKAYPAQSVKLAGKVKVGVAALNASTRPFTAAFEGLKLAPAGRADGKGAGDP
jgi:regulation of enolase protein 1 (concanavalin A-like superfamily)